MRHIFLVVLAVMSAACLGTPIDGSGDTEKPVIIIRDDGGAEQESPTTEVPESEPSSEDSQEEQQQPTKISSPDEGTLGSMNHELLQSNSYSKLIIEADYVSGHELRSMTKNELKLFFEDYSDKSSIQFSGGNQLSGGQQSYSIDDLLKLEEEHRDHYTGGDTAVLYIIILDGSFENPNALGVAYKASTFALFGEKMQGMTSSLLLYPEVQRAVTIHELGHILGLVNINYQSEIAHEDQQHKGHSNNKDSVMYWAVEDISLNTVFNLGPPYKFDSADLADIAKIKAGEY